VRISAREKRNLVSTPNQLLGQYRYDAFGAAVPLRRYGFYRSHNLGDAQGSRCSRVDRGECHLSYLVDESPI